MTGRHIRASVDEQLTVLVRWCGLGGARVLQQCAAEAWDSTPCLDNARMGRCMSHRGRSVCEVARGAVGTRTDVSKVTSIGLLFTGWQEHRILILFCNQCVMMCGWVLQ